MISKLALQSGMLGLEVHVLGLAAQDLGLGHGLATKALALTLS